MSHIRKLFSVEQKIIEHIPFFQNPDYGWVLMFHRVVEKMDNFEENITIEVDQFRRLIYILSKKCQFKSLNEVMDDENPYQIYLTFDDVYESAFVNAFTWLEGLDIPFTCFVSPGLLGKEGYIKKEHLLKMSEMKNCLIGVHGRNHRILRGLDQQEINDEVVGAREDLKRLLPSKDFKLYAYSYGSVFAVNRVARDTCASEYDYGFGTIQLPLNKKITKSNGMFMPRINVNNSNCHTVQRKIQDRLNSRGKY